MTTEEMRQELVDYCDKRWSCQAKYGKPECPLHGEAFRCGRGAHFKSKRIDDEGGVVYTMSDDEIRAAYAIVFPEPAPTIKDSGERREFETGAVRDIQEGKGRCDLLPLDVVAEVLGGGGDNCFPNSVLYAVGCFTEVGDARWLFYALEYFRNMWGVDTQTLFLEVSKHFEEGAKKYGEYNWQKGIPVHCYIDSAVRHYLKFRRGDKDEPHDRAFVWNILCAIWTCKHKPELNDYAKEGK